MAGIARVVVPGIPHHVTQRGNYQQKIFTRDEDRRRYLLWLEEYAKRYELKVWAYCLMDNHVHLVVVPKWHNSMAKTFNQTHMRYSQYSNFRMGRRGHLWQGRFYSCPLDDVHLYAAVRYVERNPVRAGLVGRAEHYPWSSARSHVTGSEDSVMSDDLSLLREIEDWAAYLSGVEDNAVMERIRTSTLSGRPAGDINFVKRIEELLGRSLVPQPRGRPTGAEK